MQSSSSMLHGLGLHHRLTEMLQRGLELYAAANAGNVSICILAVNPFAVKLQKMSLLEADVQSPRSRIFKPDILKGKSRSHSVFAPFLGEYTETSLHELNREHRQSFPVTNGQPCFFRKYSAPSVELSSDSAKVRSLSLPVMQPSATLYEFNNVNLQYHLGHFHYLYKRHIFTIDAITLKSHSLNIIFSECEEEPYSPREGHLIPHVKISQGRAKIEVREEGVKRAAEAFMQILVATPKNKLAEVFFNSPFFKKYKNSVNIEIYDSNHLPLKTLGIVKKDHHGRVQSESAFMADIDIHSCIYSENLPPSPIMNFNQQPLEGTQKKAFDEALAQEYNRLKIYLDEHQPGISAAFDWHDFELQLYHCQEMGIISAREFFLFLFLNCLSGQGHQGFIRWILQHGPTNRLSLEPESEHFRQQLRCQFERAELEFPAVTPQTHIVIVSSRPEQSLQVFQGMEVLALYARLVEQGHCHLHPQWQRQIQAYLQEDNPNHVALRRQMLATSKIIPTHSNLHLPKSLPRQSLFYSSEPLARSNSRHFLIDVDVIYDDEAYLVPH
jgi:hypothetical protein